MYIIPILLVTLGMLVALIVTYSIFTLLYTISDKFQDFINRHF